MFQFLGVAPFNENCGLKFSFEYQKCTFFIEQKKLNIWLGFFNLRTGPRSTFVPNGNGQNHLTVIVDKGPQIALPVLQKVAVHHTWMIPCWILPLHKGGKCENSWRTEDWKKIGRDLPNCRVHTSIFGYALRFLWRSSWSFSQTDLRWV